MLLNSIMLALAAAAAQPPAGPLVVTPLDLIPRPMVVEVERDPITDAISAFAVARTSDGRLSVGCDPDRYRGIRVTFRSQSWLADENFLTGRRKMTYRFDNARPVRAQWDLDDDSATLRPWRQVPLFVRSLIASQRLTIRTKDIEGREKDLRFALIHSGPAVDQMLVACRMTGVRRLLMGR